MQIEIKPQKDININNDRYEVLDVIRGISIFYMLFCHLCQFALISEDRWFWALIYIFIDIIGVPAFLFVSGVAISISIDKKLKKGKEINNSPNIINKSIRNDMLYRGLFIYFIGLLYNIGFCVSKGDLKYIWSWTILQLIGISQIALYYIKKLSIQNRFILIFGILIISEPLYYTLWNNQNLIINILGYIIFNPNNLNPILPFIFYPILGNIIGEIMVTDSTHNMKFMGKKFRSFLVIIGLFLLILSIMMGFFGEPASDENWPFSLIMNKFNISKLPRFLDRGSPSNILYCSGILMILFSIFNRYYMNIYSKKHRIYTFFSLFGRASLTLYLSHHLFYFIINQQYTVYTIWLIAAIIIGFISIIYIIWYSIADLKYGIEWSISKTRNILFKKFNLR